MSHKKIEIEYPFTMAKIRELKVGNIVSVSGLLYTGRDRLHCYLAKGDKCPVDLRDGAMYHCGPVAILKDGSWQVKAAGPTTSIREEPYMAKIIEKHRLRVVIGKGGMGEATRRACVKHGCVYLQAVGGAASLYAGKVDAVNNVHFIQEFGSAEAMWELAVTGLETIVAIDTAGKSLHKRVEAASKRALRSLLKR